jgi:glycosyltransferase involved in cell wall biosynthesis
VADRFLLSAAIITKNEEKRLPECLTSVSFADDIVVVDSGSTDNTVGIAREFGCRVFVEDWKGFGPQKNSAIDKCRYDWVLLLDADERVAQGTKEVILRTLQRPEAAAYRLSMKHFFHNKWIRHSGYWPDPHIKLVNKTKGRFVGRIHERWQAEGPVQDLDACIEHYGFSNYSDMLQTLDEYSTLISKELYDAGKRVGVLAPLSHGIGMFLKIYVLQMGLLDGLDGLAIALTKAGGSFFKYAKLLELQRRNKT